MDDYSSDTTSYAGPDLTPAIPEPSYTPEAPVADPPYMTQDPAEYLGQGDAPELADKWSQPLTENGGYQVDTETGDVVSREDAGQAYVEPLQVSQEELNEAFGVEEAASEAEAMDAASVSAAEALTEAVEAANEETAGQVTSTYQAENPDSEEQDEDIAVSIDAVYTVISANIEHGGVLVRSDGRAHMHVEKAAVTYSLDLRGESPDWRVSAVALAGLTCLDERTAPLEDILMMSIKGGLSQQRYANVKAGVKPENPSDMTYDEAPEFLRVFAEGNLPNSVPPGLL